MSAKSQQSRLKELIARGREQGYLTYAEVNDHLPEDIADPEQVEDIIRMINDMGINVFETAPDADALLLAGADTDEAAAEEAAAALAAVETDIGRTTDPVRMYMREMGTVELLTREGEIEIAKRIEEGIRDVMCAMAHFPGTVNEVLDIFNNAITEGTRLTDVFNGYIDPDEEPTQHPAPAAAAKIAAAAVKEQEDAEAAEDEDEPANTGPDPEMAQLRFGAVAAQLAAVEKILQEEPRDSKNAVAALLALGELFAPLKLHPKVYDALVINIREKLHHLRAQERAIMQLCVRDARMPRADFLKHFPGNETDLEWAVKLSEGKARYAANLVPLIEEIQRHQQNLIDLEAETSLTLADIKDINRRIDW